MSEAPNAENCPCPAECVRKGDCAACREHHAVLGNQTYCQPAPQARTAGPVKSFFRGVLKFLSYAFCPA